MNKLLFMIFTVFAILFFACDDKDKEQTNTPVCEPACNASEECKCETVDGKETCACEAKAVDDPAKECFCDEAKTVKCPEGGKETCTADPSASEGPCKCDDGSDCPDNNKEKCKKSNE